VSIDLRECQWCAGFGRVFDMLWCRYVPCEYCDGQGRRFPANDAVFGPPVSPTQWQEQR
jgi:hypothetical protein